MTVKCESTNQKLSIKKLKDIKANTVYFRLKPFKLARQNSMFINPKLYLKRVTAIKAYKGDEILQLIFRQRYKCPICKGSLLSFDVFNLCMNVEESMFIHDKYLSSFIPALTKGNFFEIKANKNSFISKFVDGKSLYQSLQIDYILPNIIGKFDDRIWAKLDEISNKVIIHRSCHKIKAAFDRETLVKEWQSLVKLAKANGTPNAGHKSYSA